jgi:hypothetical protein
MERKIYLTRENVGSGDTNLRVYSPEDDKCPLGRECVCAVFSDERNLHVCPHLGEEIAESAARPHGDCYYPEKAPF